MDDFTLEICLARQELSRGEDGVAIAVVFILFPVEIFCIIVHCMCIMILVKDDGDTRL